MRMLKGRLFWLVLDLTFAFFHSFLGLSELGKMEAPPVTVMPVTGGTINMMEYLLQGIMHKTCHHRHK